MSQPGQSRGALSSSPESEEQEMQRMKKELQKRGFDEGMSLEEMRGILETLVFSEQTANNSVEQNIPESKSPEPMSPIGQQSYAEKLKPNNGKNSKGPDLSFDQSTKSLSQEKQTDSVGDLICPTRNTIPFRKDSKENPCSTANRGRRAGNFDKSFEGKNENKRMHQRSNARTRYDEKLPELKLTRQDFDHNEEDQCLIPRYRLSNKKSPQDGNSIKPFDNDSVIFDRLRKHLLQTAEICHIQQTSSVALNFQWGTAIKVGTSNQTYNTRSNSETK